MHGRQLGRRARGAACQEVPRLSLTVRRVLDGLPRQPVRAEFGFDPELPMLVSATFTSLPGQSVTWRISRELLCRGLLEESGQGDVQVWPMRSEAEETVWLLLESNGRSAVFELPAPTLAEWLDATCRVVAVEAELDGVDWDAVVADLSDEGETTSETTGD